MYGTQMGARPGEGESSDSLADRIAGYIEHRLCGRIHYLHVSCTGGRIVLRGRSRTYYAKQLAQEAALDLFNGPARLENLIMVG